MEKQLKFRKKQSAAQEKTARAHAQHVKINPDGRVLIPALLRRKLGLKQNDDLVVSLKGEVIELASSRAMLKRGQSLLRDKITPDVSLADELIQERREAAKVE